MVGWYAAGRDPRLPTATTPPAPDGPRLRLDARIRTVWCRSVRSHRGFALAGLLACLGTAGTVAGQGMAGGLTLALAAMTALHANATVRIDEHGVTVSQTLLRRALITLPYAHIERATAVPSPAGLPRRAYGVVADGPVFGYRARADGPALRLDVAGGRACVLTVDHPETASALINARLDGVPKGARGAGRDDEATGEPGALQR